MTTGQASLFDHDAAKMNRGTLGPEHKPREEFLTGLLAQWLAGAGAKPLKEHRERASAVARNALRELIG